MKNVNVVAAIVAAIVVFIFGSIWYGVLFNQVWMEGWGLSEDIIAQTVNPISGVYNFLTLIAYAIVFAMIQNKMGKNNIVSALKVGLLISLGLIIPGAISNAIYANASTQVIFVDAFYLLLRGIIISLFMGGWRKKAPSTS